MRLNRRVALRWLVFGGLAAVASREGYLWVSGRNLLGDGGAFHAAERLGRSYLAAQTATAEELCQTIFSVSLRELEAMKPQSVAERVRAAAQADFQAGRVTELGEWCVSVSEARLCALVFLLSQNEQGT